jgi:hypothetical protein
MLVGERVKPNPADTTRATLAIVNRFTVPKQ